MAKGKKFTLADLDLKLDHINKQEKYYTDKENEQYISYFPKFSQTKKDKLFAELSETVSYVKESKLEYFTNDLELIHYLQFLIFKYFTSLFNELEAKSVETNIETYTKLYNSGLLTEFINNVFEKEEIEKVMNQFYDITERAPLLAHAMKDFKDEVAKNVQSDVIKNKLKLEDNK